MIEAPPPETSVVECQGSGGPEVLVPARRPTPQPGAGEVLIMVEAAGVNGPDLMQRRGLYPAPPGASDLLGLEVAGTIAAVGDGVHRWAPGDRVCALTNGGGYAAHCVVDANHCLQFPNGLAAREAASLPETFFTVWSNIFMPKRLAAGQTLLVHGGAGGIGSTAIQLAKAFGATVHTTVADAEQAAFCTELGADRAIVADDEDFVDVVRREAQGAHVILDIIGGNYIERNFKAAQPDGVIVQLAFAKGSKLDVNLMPVMLKRLVYTGSTLRSRSAAFKSAVARELERDVWPLFGEGKLRTVVHAEMPLSDAAEAHRLMESGAHRGKILLVP